MPSAPADFHQLKQQLKHVWSAGDFGQIARITEREAESFVQRLQPRAGMKVLDVACGTGNQSLPAARAGADVTGVDIAANSLEQARARAIAAGLKIRFEEGDAEQLHFGDGSFDMVLSMFGAMFAPRPERVAAELRRVCRQGGTIGMANWTANGFVGESFRLTAKHVPPPPGVPAPVLWGDEKVVRQRLGEDLKIEIARRQLVFDHPFGPEATVQLFAEFFGPTKVALSRLDDNGKKAFLADMIHHWNEHNEGDQHHTIVRAEYLEVMARR